MFKDFNFKFQGILLALIINSNIFIALNFPFNNFLTFISFLLLLFFSSKTDIKIFDQLKSFNLLVFIFILYVTFSLFQNPSNYSLNAYFKYLIILVICFICSLQTNISIKVFLQTTVFLNFIFCLVSVYDVNIILLNENTNYLSATYTLGMSIIIILISMYFKFNFIKLGLFLFFLFAMIKFPSRGTIIFSLLVSCIFLVKHRPKKSFISKIVFWCLIVFLYYGIIFSIDYFLRDTYLLARFEDLIYSSSEEPRIALYNQALEGISINFLLGLGVGNSGIALGNNLGVYPHNIFLEVFLELGFIGLIIFLILLTKSLVLCLKSYKLNNLGVFLFYIFLYAFFTFQKSFSLIFAQFLLIPLCLSFSIYKNNFIFKLKQ